MFVGWIQSNKIENALVKKAFYLPAREPPMNLHFKERGPTSVQENAPNRGSGIPKPKKHGLE